MRAPGGSDMRSRSRLGSGSGRSLRIATWPRARGGGSSARRKRAGWRGGGRAEAVAAKGARVAMVAREAGPLGDAVATIRARGGLAHAIAADIADKDAVHKIAGQAQGLVGEVGIVIHNASSLGPVPLRL